MDYKWLRDFSLKLLDQYSVSGEAIPEGYNNQADYLARIPMLADDAQIHIATTSGKIRALASVNSLQAGSMGEWILYKLPEDCWQVCSGGLVRCDGPRMQRYHRYHLVGNHGIAVPEKLDGAMWLEYYRYPRLLGTEPKDGDKLDNTVEAQMALPYYVAAHLVMHDNAFAYQALMNEFESKLARIAERPQTELNVVEDAYSPAEAYYNE